MLNLNETFQKMALKDASGAPTGPAYAVKAMLDRGYFDPYEEAYLAAWKNMGKQDTHDIRETIDNPNLPLRDWLDISKDGALKEYLASSPTTGIAGTYYTIPVKLFNELQLTAYATDHTAEVSKLMLMPDQLGTGTTQKVDIVVDNTLRPRLSSPIATAYDTTFQTVQATLDFTDVWMLNFPLAGDLLEDGAFDLLAAHIQQGGEAIGEKAFNMACTIIGTAPDGDGTINSSASGDNNQTKYTGGGTAGIDTAIAGVANNHWNPDTAVIAKHAWLHSVITTLPNYAEPLAGQIHVNPWNPPTLGGLKWIFTECDYIVGATNGAWAAGHEYHDCKTLVFDKSKAIITGRKRWMRLENYADPVKDLKGAVISFRQDSVSLYKDSIYLITETAA